KQEQAAGSIEDSWRQSENHVQGYRSRGNPRDNGRDFDPQVQSSSADNPSAAFNGLPGAYVKWFLKELGPQGLYNMLASFDNKRAYARCTFAYTAGPGQDILLFTGTTKGTIVPPRGKTTFGWDPIFQPEDYSLTYAEMTSEEKNSVSHRYKALAQLQEYLESVNQ
ncbi:hypothetical protein BB560_005528, partial [Smittium megazygosporum]